MNHARLHQMLTYLIAVIWLINGLVCKAFNMVPRHQQIVARILHTRYDREITVAIGLAEIGMAVWILSGIQRRLNVITQIAIIGSMNLLEFFLAPDLLLWGRLNLFFAVLLILVILYNEFFLRKKLALT